MIKSSYITLSYPFYQEIAPTVVSNPSLIKFNHELAAYLNIEQNVLLFAGNEVPAHLNSIALAYAGDQFGHYVPLLGDGRAVLLGEVLSQDNMRWDIQLKGSGRTMFSRTGDGRAPLSAALREYIMSEAMHGLGIPTTRSLAVTTSDDLIYRQSGPVPQGVLTRVARGYLRVGSFQYAANLNDTQLLKQLADYALERHFPQELEHDSPYLALFNHVIDSQAHLIADWMGVGFIHGVMNTDNMAISGETIDYGPCAFMDEFDENTVFSSIDRAGRYAYNNQVHSAHWNLARFGAALSPLFTDTAALQESLNTFPERFKHYWTIKINSKLGFVAQNSATSQLIERFMRLLQQYRPDFTHTFRHLCYTTDSVDHQDSLLKMLGNQAEGKQWITDWLTYITHQDIDIAAIKASMEQVNPAYIPRNHLVEKAIQLCIVNKDHTLMKSLLKVCSRPYEQQKDTEDLQRLPEPHERVLQTFCGT